MENFSTRLRALRVSQNLSLKQLSVYTKIGPASLCRWENGNADVHGSQLIILAKFFGVSTDYLLGLED